MPNRFVQAIRAGQIDSIADLKLHFRSLAKQTHPDLVQASLLSTTLRRSQIEGGHGARIRPGSPDVATADTDSARIPHPVADDAEAAHLDAAPHEAASHEATPHDAFIRVREEYERALASFDRYRYGSEASSGEESRRAQYRSDPARALSLVLDRGFPKVPRHDKERQRYAWACSVFVESLGDPALGQTFRALERWMLGLEEVDAAGFSAILAWLSRLATCRTGSGRVSGRSSGLPPALIAELGMGLQRLSESPGLRVELADFLGVLLVRIVPEAGFYPSQTRRPPQDASSAEADVPTETGVSPANRAWPGMP